MNPAMNLIPMFAAVGDVLKGGWIIIAIIGIALVFFVGFLVVLSRYTKVGPNEVLVVSGRKHRYLDPDGTDRVRGFRIVKGGGTFVYPIIEKIDILSLELLTIDVNTPEVYTSKVVPGKVDGSPQFKVRGNDFSIATAAEQFFGKGFGEIRTTAMRTPEGNCGAIFGPMTCKEFY